MLAKNSFEIRSLLKPCKDGEIPEILDLSGGKFCVPQRRKDAEASYVVFLRALAASIERGENNCFSEVATQPFKLYVDIDAQCESLKQAESFPKLEIALAVRQVLLARGVAIGKTLSVVLTPPGSKKVGIHIIFPQFVVDVATALTIREESLPLIDAALKKVESPLCACDIFDAAVYGKGKGLRMIGASKSATERRPYGVDFVVSASGRPDVATMARMKKNITFAILTTSIRTTTTVAPTLKKSEQTLLASRRVTAKSSFLKEDFYEAIAGIHECFRTCRVVDIVSRPHVVPRFSGLFLKLDNHRFCPHVNREHRSSSLFLRINVFGEVTAGCFCKKHGCDKWRSKKVVLCCRILKRLGLTNVRGVPVGFVA